MLPPPGDHGVTHHAHTMRIGNGDRAFQKPGLLNPRCSRHLTVAVLREPPSINGVRIHFAARKDDRYSGPDRSLAHLQRAVAGDQRCLANLDTANVGDGVQRSRCSIKGHAKVPSTRCGLRVHCRCHHEEDTEQEWRLFPVKVHAWNAIAQFRTAVEESCLQRSPPENAKYKAESPCSN